MEYMTAIYGAAGAAIIAATGYLKARGEGDVFEPVKFIQTVIIGAVAGFTLGLTGVQISDSNVAAQMGSYAFLGGGIAIFIENIGKYFYRLKVPALGTPVVVPVGVIPRDGKKLYDGVDGWWVRINPSPEAASLPDDKCYQAVSPKGTYWSGDKDTIKYLVSDPASAGWRSRNA